MFAGGVDVVFPVLHGPMGEDGTVQGMLELTGIPYVGSGVLGSALSMDKAMAKTVLAQAGLPQVPWRLITRKEWERDPDACTEWVGEILGFPCFVKPANMGSSVGVVKAHDPSEFPAAMREAGRYDRRILIEQGVDARELEISVLGNDEPIASIVGEIVPGNEFYDYNAKYVDDDSELLVPAPNRPRHDGRDPGDGDRRLPRPRSGRDGASRFLHGPRHRPDLHQRGQHDSRLHRDQHVPASLGRRAGCRSESWWTDWSGWPWNAPLERRRTV